MKLVFVSYVYTPAFTDPGAWLYRIRAYAGIQASLSARYQVTGFEQIDYEGEYHQNGVRYNFIKLSAAGRFFPRKLHRYIKNEHPDVVMVQGLHFPAQVIQLHLMLGRSIRIIAHHHAEIPFKGVKKIIQQLADRFIDAYLFASKPMGLDWVKKGNLASPHKIHEVMEVSSPFYPVDKTMAKLKTGVAAGTVFLWVGRLNTNKDPLNVVKAFIKFASCHPEARLYMIYHTTELLPDIKTLIAGSPFENNIVLVGKIPNDELLYWYNGADFFISGSHYEGAGAAVCEAMSCGCIPIVTSIFSFTMMTDNGNCGILYQPGNADALLAALNKSLTLDTTEMRARILVYFKKQLSFEAIACRIGDVAASLINR